MAKRILSVSDVLMQVVMSLIMARLLGDTTAQEVMARMGVAIPGALLFVAAWRLITKDEAVDW